jgi:Fe-S-cluster containining protein
MTETKCEGCANCCKDVSVEMDKPEDFEDFETVKWMIAHQNVTVYIDHDDDWLVEFATRCKFLDESNKCKIYKERYKMCSEHDPEECVMNGDEEHYKKIFRTADDVDEYMKEIGFYEKYLEEKKRLNGS